MAVCTLCRTPNALPFQVEPFLRCPNCNLIFKNRQVQLSTSDEKARYSTHQNHIENTGYVNFFTPVVWEITKVLPRGAKGLDYGCGPGPVLSELLSQKGFVMTHYDPLFFPMELNAKKEFDFITCTEAAEHFFNPGVEVTKIYSLLKPKGFLFLMTELYVENSKLQDWYYPRDPTHVCFYSTLTLNWISERFNRKLRVINPRLFAFSSLG